MSTKIKTHFSFINSKPLLETAEFLHANINYQEHSKCSNRHAFIVAVAAFMEARLNEALNDWGQFFSSIESGAKHAGSFLTMNLRSKLDTIFFIYTNGEFVTNIESRDYQYLSRLITIRNQVAHSKPFTMEADIEFHNQEDGSRSFQLPAEFINKAEGKVNELSSEDLQILLSSVKELDRALDFEFLFESSPLCKKVEQVKAKEQHSP